MQIWESIGILFGDFSRALGDEVFLSRTRFPRRIFISLKSLKSLKWQKVEQIAYKTKSKLRILGFRGIQIESLGHVPICENRIGKWRNRVGKRRPGSRKMCKYVSFHWFQGIPSSISFDKEAYEIGKPRHQERGKSLQKGWQWMPRFAFALTRPPPFAISWNPWISRKSHLDI